MSVVETRNIELSAQEKYDAFPSYTKSGMTTNVLPTAVEENFPPFSSTGGVTPLMQACQQGHESSVRQLIHKDARIVRERDRTGKTALHYCAENSSLTCIDQILAVDPSLLSARDEDGYTPLHLATIAGNRSVVRYLLSKGADVHATDNEKHTAVHWATVCGEVELLELLIESGGNPSTPDIHGAYPIHYAAQMCGPNSELGQDVKAGLLVLQTLLQKGVDISVKDQDGRQPLLWAASAEVRPSHVYCPSGSADAILALVNAGADVASDDKDGLTALHCAASRGHLDCLDVLISLCSAEVDTLDANGCTPLFYAATLGHADCTELLLKHGSIPDRQDRKGRTPAHCGAAKGQLETLKLLHKRGADLWKRNVKGDLPLHEAIQSGRKDLVMWLLSLQPASVNAPNNDGRCPLHIAAINNNTEMCKILMDYKATVNPIMRNSRGQLLTPVDAAVARGNKGCAKYLQLHGGLPAIRLTDKRALQAAMQRALEFEPTGHTGATPSDLTAEHTESSTPTMSKAPFFLEIPPAMLSKESGTEPHVLSSSIGLQMGYTSDHIDSGSQTEGGTPGLPGGEIFTSDTYIRDLILNEEQLTIKEKMKLHEPGQISELLIGQTMATIEAPKTVKKEEEETKKSKLKSKATKKMEEEDDDEDEAGVEDDQKVLKGTKKHKTKVEKTMEKDDDEEEEKLSKGTKNHKKKSKKAETEEDDEETDEEEEKKSKKETKKHKKNSKKTKTEEESDDEEEKETKKGIKKHKKHSKKTKSEEESDDEEEKEPKKGTQKHKNSKKTKTEEESDDEEEKETKKGIKKHKKHSKKTKSEEESDDEEEKETKKGIKTTLKSKMSRSTSLESDKLRSESQESEEESQDKTDDHKSKKKEKNLTTKKKKGTKKGTKRDETTDSDNEDQNSSDQSASSSSSSESESGTKSESSEPRSNQTDQEKHEIKKKKLKSVKTAKKKSASESNDEDNAECETINQTKKEASLIEGSKDREKKRRSKHEKENAIKKNQKEEIGDIDAKEHSELLKESDAIDDATEKVKAKKISKSKENLKEKGDRKKEEREGKHGKKLLPNQQEILAKKESLLENKRSKGDDKARLKKSKSLELIDSVGSKSKGLIERKVASLNSSFSAATDKKTSLKTNVSDLKPIGVTNSHLKGKKVPVQNKVHEQSTDKLKNSSSDNIAGDGTAALGKPARELGDGASEDGENIAMTEEMSVKSSRSKVLKKKSASKSSNGNRAVDVSSSESAPSNNESTDDGSEGEAHAGRLKEGQKSSSRSSVETVLPLQDIEGVVPKKSEQSYPTHDERVHELHLNTTTRENNLGLVQDVPASSVVSTPKFPKQNISKLEKRNMTKKVANQQGENNSTSENSDMENTTTKGRTKVRRKTKKSPLKNKNGPDAAESDDSSYETSNENMLQDGVGSKIPSLNGDQSSRIGEMKPKKEKLLKGSKNIDIENEAEAIGSKGKTSNIKTKDLRKGTAPIRKGRSVTINTEGKLPNGDQKEDIKEAGRRVMSGGPRKVDSMDTNLKKKKNAQDYPADMSVTRAMQTAMRKYTVERRLFQQLLDLKRLQIRNSRANEHMLIKRMVDEHWNDDMIGLKSYNGAYSFTNYEKYLYDQLRTLQSSDLNKIHHFKGNDDVEKLTRALRKANVPELNDPIDDLINLDREKEREKNVNLCNQSTHRCHHAIHAYTGVPCAAYLAQYRRAEQKTKGTLPRVGAPNGARNTVILENKKDEPGVARTAYDPQKPLTVEFQHGSAKQQISLPTNFLDHTRRYQLTVSIQPTNGKKEQEPLVNPLSENLPLKRDLMKKGPLRKDPLKKDSLNNEPSNKGLSNREPINMNPPHNDPLKKNPLNREPFNKNKLNKNTLSNGLLNGKDPINKITLNNDLLKKDPPKRGPLKNDPLKKGPLKKGPLKKDPPNPPNSDSPNSDPPNSDSPNSDPPNTSPPNKDENLSSSVASAPETESSSSLQESSEAPPQQPQPTDGSLDTLSDEGVPKESSE